MIRYSLRLMAGLALGLACAFAAEPAKQKSPGDLAAEAFFKLRDDKDATLTAARIQQLMGSGLGFLTTYPDHARVNAVITGLANFGGTIKDKKQLPMRDYWNSQLNYEIINRRTKSDVTDDVRLVLTALDAASAGAQAKTTGGKDLLDNFRSKIDRLADLEGSGRFLVAQERDYVQLLYSSSPKLGEAQAQKLAASSDKKLAAVGQEELNLIVMAKQPLELTAPLLGGGQFDAAKLRGKVVYFVFWSSTNEASVKELTPLVDLYKPYQKLGVEIVTVAHDTDAEALAKFVKAKGYAWPVIFDGLGAKGDFSQRLNIRNLPGSALFTQQGMFTGVGVRTSQLEPAVMKLGIKRK